MRHSMRIGAIAKISKTLKVERYDHCISAFSWLGIEIKFHVP